MNLLKAYRKEVSRAHAGQLAKRLEGEDGREEVVAVRQHRHEERRPETKIITLESRNSGKRLLLLSLTTSVTRLGDF